MQDIKEQNNYNTKRIEIEKIYYQVCNNEFLNIYIQKYCNLNMFTDVGELERIIGLISDLSDDLSSTNVITFNATHGGFIPLQLSKRIKNNYISFVDANKHKNHISNFLINREKFGSDKVNEIHITEIEKLSWFSLYNGIFSKGSINCGCRIINCLFSAYWNYIE